MQRVATLLVIVLAAGACGLPAGTSAPTPPLEVPDGWDSDAITALIAMAEGANTDALVVIHGGNTIVEHYFDNAADFTRDIASAQKSIVALLIGIAQDRNLLDIDDPVTDHLGSDWTAGAATEDSVTIRDLLTMSSGLDADFETVAEPGTYWEYNNNAYHKLRPVLEAVAGSDIQTLSDGWLFDRLGVDGEWYLRGLAGIAVRDSQGDRLMGLRMGAADLAAVGLMVLNDGEWNGQRIISSGYLAEALAPSQAMNPAYGFLWWLNGSATHVVPITTPGAGMIVPEAPDDAVGALGAQDQKLWVSQELDLVIVRLGDTAVSFGAAQTAFDNQLWNAVLAGYPSSG